MLENKSFTCSKTCFSPSLTMPKHFSATDNNGLIRMDSNNLDNTALEMGTLCFLHVLLHPYCVYLYVKKEHSHHSFKELTNFPHQGNKTS